MPLLTPSSAPPTPPHNQRPQLFREAVLNTVNNLGGRAKDSDFAFLSIVSASRRRSMREGQYRRGLVQAGGVDVRFSVATPPGAVAAVTQGITGPGLASTLGRAGIAADIPRSGVEVGAFFGV